MQKIEYTNFIGEWSRLFPEFLASEDFDKDYSDDNLSYPFLADFSRFLMKKIEAPDASKDPIVQRVFDVINAQFEIIDADPEILNLFALQILEPLAETKTGIAISKEKLISPNAIKSFNESIVQSE
jgi:hypothetical protein